MSKRNLLFAIFLVLFLCISILSVYAAVESEKAKYVHVVDTGARDVAELPNGKWVFSYPVRNCDWPPSCRVLYADVYVVDPTEVVPKPSYKLTVSWNEFAKAVSPDTYQTWQTAEAHPYKFAVLPNGNVLLQMSSYVPPPKSGRTGFGVSITYPNVEIDPNDCNNACKISGWNVVIEGVDYTEACIYWTHNEEECKKGFYVYGNNCCKVVRKGDDKTLPFPSEELKLPNGNLVTVTQFEVCEVTPTKEKVKCFSSIFGDILLKYGKPGPAYDASTRTVRKTIYTVPYPPSGVVSVGCFGSSAKILPNGNLLITAFGRANLNQTDMKYTVLGCGYKLQFSDEPFSQFAFSSVGTPWAADLMKNAIVYLTPNSEPRLIEIDLKTGNIVRDIQNIRVEDLEILKNGNYLILESVLSLAPRTANSWSINYLRIAEIEGHPAEVTTKTCSQQGGYCCAAELNCPGTLLAANDCDECCNVACSSLPPSPPQPKEALNLYSGWNMFSLPLQTTAGSELFSYCGVVSPFWHYDPVIKNYVKATSFVPGQGYWVKLSGDCTVEVSGSYFDLDGTQLKAGWNQIGTSSITTNIDDVKGSCEIKGGPWRYDSVKRDYVFSSSLVPGYGYWVKVANDCSLSYSLAPPPVPS
jgi:hypothetical protein